ncbi:hypothetical protein FOL47_004177, partial [Perkinsus chesapeaki]
RERKQILERTKTDTRENENRYWRERKQIRKAGPTTTFEFADRSKVTTFIHTLTLNFGTKTADGLHVGLVSRFEPSTSPHGRPPTIPWASLGLRKTSVEAPEYKCILEQLLAQPPPQRLIESYSFSIYTKPGMHPTGEVILGGQDPTKYDGLLDYVRIVDDEEQFVQLLGLGIGKRDKDRIRVKAMTVIDSGTINFVFPISLKKDILKLLRTAGKKKVDIEEKSGFYTMQCNKAEYLPSITFYLAGLQGEEVPLTLPGVNMVTEGDGNGCYVNVEFDEVDEWFIGSRALVGYYYFYELSESRIGFAVARP